MQNLILLRIEDPSAQRQYLFASDSYLAERRSGKRYISMHFPFPNVKASCPLCNAGGCARWKGYYERGFFCVVLDHKGPLAIHAGHCQTKDCDFSYFPSFLVPGRPPSQSTLERFSETARENRNTSQAIEVLSEGLSDPDISIPSSTAYSWMYKICVSLTINQWALGLSNPVTKSVYAIYDAPLRVLTELFRTKGCRWNVHQSIVFYPP